MADPFQGRKPDILLVEKCYACDARCGCILLIAPENRVSTFRAECKDCDNRDKPDCFFLTRATKLDVPALCRACAQKTS